MSARFFDLVRAVSDLAVPMLCPGCGTSISSTNRDQIVCRTCQQELSVQPVRISPRVPAIIPTFSCGPYAGARRNLVIHAKEHNSEDARQALGALLDAALGRLISAGVLAPPEITPMVLIPAPTKKSAARRRGGDPVTIACRFAARRRAGVLVAPILQTASMAKDSSELGASARRRNISGAVVIRNVKLAYELLENAPRQTFVLVDDVITTGSTAKESTLVLASLNIELQAVIALSQA